MRIVSAGNTIVPACLVIRDKGYIISKDDGPGVSEETWRATKDDIELVAEDPLSLLGLVAMYEARGTTWKATDDEIDAFTKHFDIDA